MKKVFIGICAALLAVVMLVTVLAELATDKLYDNLTDLLFYTSNVTLKAKVDFSLNGQWFKTADVTLKQDGSRSYRQMLLTSPRSDGTEQKNGYTIVTNGEALYLMEVYTPGIYRIGGTGVRTSLLRRSVETEGLVRLGGLVASNAELLLGQDLITETGDGEYRIRMGTDAPAAVNAVLNQLARFAAKRYFSFDYDGLNAENYNMRSENFGTVTDGIIGTMKNLSVCEADLTAKVDGNGDLSSLDGKVVLDMETIAEGVKKLEIDIHLVIEDIFGTTVELFDPAKFGVMMAM